MALIANRTPSLDEVIRIAMEHRLSDVHVALPGRVLEYDASTQTATVKPLIQSSTLAANGEEIGPEPIPIIHQVPIIFPRAGGFSLTFPVSEGDNVLLVVIERSIDSYMSSDGTTDVDARTLRMHNVTDAVAYPGFFPDSMSLESHMTPNNGLVLGSNRKDGARLRITDSNKIQLSVNDSSPEPAVLGSKLKAYIDGLVSVFNAHVHGTPSGASTGPASAPDPSIDPPPKPTPLGMSSYDAESINSSSVTLPGN